MEKNNPKWILIHCTDHPRSLIADQFESCDLWHKARDFPLSSLGYRIGYHRLITGEKNYQARLDTDVGAHCNQHVNGLSLNFQSLGVCVGFDGDIEQMTAMEYALLQKQIWQWQDKFHIPNENVKFHRDFATGKTCPGSLFSKAWLTELLKRPVVVSVAPKPEDKMCIAEEKLIAEQTKELKEYRKWWHWFVRAHS